MLGFVDPLFQSIFTRTIVISVYGKREIMIFQRNRLDCAEDGPSKCLIHIQFVPKEKKV